MKISHAVSLFMVAILTACTTVGNKQMENQTEGSISQFIVKGKTTKLEVTARFGIATSTSFTDSGNEIWRYNYARSTPHAISFIPFVRLVSSGADVAKKELVIMFNKEHVVSEYTMKESEVVVKSGMAH
ncbi:lipoprotein [Nitrosomonas sp. Is79A3]|uniref:hypothetical protein n=1 Tax=Nitrosomonas sp. (strain Is79A3) TaxID=261292 RepID=UPI000215D27C